MNTRNVIVLQILLKRVAVLLAGTAFFLSCESGIDVTPYYDIDNLPTLSLRNLETVQTDSGKVQVVIKAGLMERFTHEEQPYAIFEEGLDVKFFDGQPEPIAYIIAGSAKYYEEDELWELRNNVKVRNEKNELLETELLYWDEEREIVYTDRFVRITGEDRRVEGTNFSADQRLTRWEIKNGNATIYLKDEQEL